MSPVQGFVSNGFSHQPQVFNCWLPFSRLFRIDRTLAEPLLPSSRNENGRLTAAGLEGLMVMSMAQSSKSLCCSFHAFGSSSIRVRVSGQSFCFVQSSIASAIIATGLAVR